MNSTMLAKTTISQYLENIKRDLSSNRDQKANLKKAIVSIDSLLSAINQFNEGKIMVISRKAKASELEITTKPSSSIKKAQSKPALKLSSAKKTTKKPSNQKTQKLVTKSTKPASKSTASSKSKIQAKKTIVKSAAKSKNLLKSSSSKASSKKR
ncbi:MAG: hypothetical protein SFT81_04805 [Candidatus Caenarcaniphilales bacterium]|nr:hypothetical protein [Candidatus Caenarcaniphilales bacterium]